MALLGENIRGNLLHILTLAAAFSLVLTSPATAPTEPSPGVIANTTILPGPGDKYCDTDGSDFENGSSSGSPLIEDCGNLSSIMTSAPNDDNPYGWWEVQHCTPNCKWWLAKYQTCEFGVSADGPFGEYKLGITRVDIAAILDLSIEKFSWYKQVGASGDMQCNIMNGADEPTGEQHGMSWSIAHT